MNDITDFLQKEHNFSKLKLHRNGSIWRLALSSAKDVIEFYNLYKNNNIHLERKMETFKQIIHIAYNKKQRIRIKK